MSTDFTSPTTVAFFIFNRPEPTRQVFERIRAARPKRLLVVADGPRASRPQEAQLCQATRKIVTSPDWPCELLTNFADQNLGCRRRVSSGLDWVFQQSSDAIILEDDCLPNASFFRFCTEMLDRYRDDSRVMHISGNNYQDGHKRGDGSYFFSRYPLSWGWASWSRAWRHYDLQMGGWPQAYRGGWLESIINSSREAQHWDSIFDSSYLGKIDTWDYQWVFACWRQNGLSIQPGENLVTNIGVGPDATHFKQGHTMVGYPMRELGELVHPSGVVRNDQADRYTFDQYIDSKNSASLEDVGWLLRTKRRMAIRSRIKRMLPRSWRYS